MIERPFEDVTQGDYKQILLDVLLSRFFQEILWRFDVVIDHDRIQPRGQMKNHSIIMAANIRSFDELAKVLVHELGHIVDIYYLQRSGITRDLSHTYYEISWEDVDTQKSGASSSDFIS